jgi:hypothetical protein
MSIGALNIGQYKNMTATANVLPRQGALLGFYVNSTTGGTIQFYDSATTGTGTPITGVITPVVGWHEIPVGVTAGVYAVIANTLNVTVVTA